MSERNIRWDILKALMLIILCVGHVGGFFPALARVVRYSWAPFGFFSMGEAFVFVSAVLTGVSFSRHQSLREKSIKTIRRIERIYKYYFLLTAFAIFAIGFYHGNLAPHDLFSFVRERPLTIFYLASLFVLTLPLVDILAFYILVLIPTPLIVYCLQTQWKYLIIAASLMLWAISQLYQPQFDFYFPIFRSFNPFAWQFLFVLGLYYGVVHYQKDFGWSKIIDWTALICAIYFFLLRHNFVDWPLSNETFQLLYNPRHLLPLGVILNLLVFFRALRLLSVLEYENWPELRWLGNWIGRESLLAYSWSVFIYYLFILLNINLKALTQTEQIVIFAAALVGMLLPVAYTSRKKSSSAESAGKPVNERL